jgi:RNA polymerase sigma-70 factor, ECF subfamily
MTAPGKVFHDSERAGNHIAESIYDAYAPALLSLCLRYCGNIEDAEDVLHDGFIKIIRNLHKFRKRDKGSFEGWMKRIVVNTALNFLRNSARERHFLDIDPIQEKLSAPSEEETILDEIKDKVDVQTVMDLVCQLPAGYRAVFNMYVFESFSHREIAATLNCSENTSKSQLSKARAMLRKKLNELVIEQKETR